MKETDNISSSKVREFMVKEPIGEIRDWMQKSYKNKQSKETWKELYKVCHFADMKWLHVLQFLRKEKRSY